MNPKYYLLAAVAALSLGACSTDDTCTDPVPEPEKEGYKISFTVAEDDPESRTTLDAGDILRWVYTDQVGIYTVGKNTNSNALTVADVNQSPVEFIGVLENYVSKGDMFYAYYPYDAAQSTDPAAVTLSIPAKQKQTVAGVYNGESNPLVALPVEIDWEHNSYAGRISSVRFKQLGAIVELQLHSSAEALRSESIRSVAFLSDTPLAGDFQFNLTTVTIDGEPTIAGYESTGVSTMLEEPAVIPATSDEAARIYLTIAPGTYTGKVVVNTDAAQYTFNLAEAMTFDRAVIKGLPADLAEAARNADAFIHFEDPAVERICVENWDTNGDGALSPEEAAAVTDLQKAFTDNKEIVSFNELQYFTGLQSIGNEDFEYCSSLTSIHIPDGVTKIGNYAFYSCYNLTSINIPDGVTAIGKYAFYQCAHLTSINIPDGVTAINGYTFYGCSSMTRITIPNGVTTISYHAFEGCSNLTSITIPDGVTTIGNGAFWSCISLTSANIPDGVTRIGDDTFYNCSSLTNITIPDGVTYIGNYAFERCSSLTSINIPQTVSSIGESAFQRCSSLSAFHGKYASEDNRCLIKDGTLLVFAPADRTEYTIPEGVTAIGASAFEACSSLTSITIPAGVTTIRNSAFSYCSSLTSINIPDGVTTIEGWAFSNCGSLTNINIPNGVTAIGDGTFSRCSSLTSITIPDGVTAIGASAFSGCSSLTSVYCKPATPPTMSTNFGEYNAFNNTPLSLKIYVPAASAEAYKAAQGWSTYASKIFADNN